MRGDALLTGLRTFKEVVAKNISNGVFGARNWGLRVIAKSARRLQLPCRTLHKKKRIRKNCKKEKEDYS